jgi:hypothetical protein
LTVRYFWLAEIFAFQLFFNGGKLANVMKELSVTTPVTK